MASMDRIVLAVHLVGVLAWISGLFFVARIMVFRANRTSADGDSVPKELADLAKKVAILADVGATTAMLAGLHSLFAYKIYAFAWMHTKLLLVAIIIILHVYLRREVKRATQGQASSQFPMPPILGLLVVAIVLLAAIKPF